MAALGHGFEAPWFDIWEQVEPILSNAYAGIPTQMDDIAFVMHRNGYSEETHFAFVRIDLLITDVGLPKGMNGRQVADAARELRPGLKVLFVTGYAENAVLSHGDLAPGMQVVTKPFDLVALGNRIRAMIAG